MKKKLLLILIILLAIFLRFYHLSSYPALNADEAAIGYNAYSLIETGKDEHGNAWPIHFQSFNDFKPGLYFYLAIPFVKSLGLNELAVRLPGALLGVLTVYLVYLLVKELFDNERLAIISSLFLAISPWHIHFSRGAWEVNVATFFIVLGTFLFIKAKENGKYYTLSLVSFALSLYTYHAARVIVPLLGIGLVGFNFKEVKKQSKSFLMAVFIAFLVLLPLGKDLLQGSVLSRAAGVGLFADPGPINRINEQRGQHKSFTSFVAKALHNKLVNYGLAFGENLTDHFSGEFLFNSGDDIQRDKVPETGVLYLFDLLFIIVAFFAIVKKPKNWGIILWWLIISPTAAALTFQSPHALRAQNMVIPITVISAYGAIYIFDSSRKYKKAIALVLSLFVLWNFSRYQHMYWVHMAKEYPFSSQYGVKELVNYVEENRDKYQQIVVTNKYDQPYTLFLFYLKYPPEKFQDEHILTARDEYGFSTVNHFDKYYFMSLDNWQDTRKEYSRALISGTEEEIPEEANIIKRIYGTNNFLYFKVVAN